MGFPCPFNSMAGLTWWMRRPIEAALGGTDAPPAPQLGSARRASVTRCLAPHKAAGWSPVCAHPYYRPLRCFFRRAR